MRGILIFLFFSGMAYGQQPSWVLKIGDYGNDLAENVRELSPGNFYVSGYSASGNFGNMDFMLIKVSEAGNIGWTKFYGTAEDDYCLFMDTVSDERLILGGQVTNAQAESDCLIVLTDSAGNEIWSRIFGGPGNQSLAYISESPDGGFFGTGFATASNGTNDIYFVKLDSAGYIEWDTTYGGTNNDYADAAIYHDSSYVITADTRSSGAGAYDVYLVKTDYWGNVIWDYTFGDAFNNGCQGLLKTSDEHYLSFGETEISAFSYFDFYVEKIDPAGNSLWRRTFGGLSADAAFSVIELNDGYLLTGYSSSYSPGPLNLVLFKIDTAGYLQWINNYGGPGIDIGYDLTRGVNGGIMIAGKYSDSALGSQAYILYFDSTQLTGIQNEAVAQKKVFPNPTSGDFFITGLNNESVVEILSVEGRLLCSRSVNENGRIILDPDLPSGIYFGRVLGDEHFTFKLILAR